MSARISHLVAFALLLLGACEDLGRPADPVWNKQDCAHCHMLLSDPRYAAQASTAKGARLYFDDVGCLAAMMQRDPASIRHAWVHGTGGWRDAASARYAQGAPTPMGFGFAADEHGTLGFAAVRQAVGARLSQGEP